MGESSATSEGRVELQMMWAGDLRAGQWIQIGTQSLGKASEVLGGNDGI